MRIPRVMLAAPASGSGKTMITCGLLQVLKEQDRNPVAFKCGPDYIDPQFHESVLHTKSRNLDPFFTEPSVTRYLLEKHAQHAGIAVMEGVMGFYDGLGGVTTKASAYELSIVTQTPVLLIVDCRGMSASIPALIRGFLAHRPDQNIQGVILNRMNKMLYPAVKELIEQECSVQVCGYVPQTDTMQLESRHLGLVLPGEIKDLEEKVKRLAALLTQTLDIPRILKIAEEAPELTREQSPFAGEPRPKEAPVIAVARDEAFCFLYEDNLDLLRECGARLTFFSPVHDTVLPKADGLLLCGGYPELFLPQLSGNEAMRAAIRDAVSGGLPTLAECGGFMYLQQEIADESGTLWPMAGVLDGKCEKQDRLKRFGYVTLQANEAFRDTPFAQIGPMRAHEFHYYESTACGEAFHASKPVGKRGWDCMVATQTMLCGYPHLYYYANPRIAETFTALCAGHQS